MPHFVEELRLEAEAAIVRMQEAALLARAAHARAELMRHMLNTARKVVEKPKAEAVDTVVTEWMAAWNLGRTDWPHIAREMEAFTEACRDYADMPSEAHDSALRAACSGLEAAFAGAGSSIADEMAFRSQCAHGWWQLVRPVPADLPGRKERPSVPHPVEGEPFWGAGCADFCR